jgi:hypothetical protein
MTYNKRAHEELDEKEIAIVLLGWTWERTKD